MELKGLQHHIREHVRLAQEFAGWVRGDRALNWRRRRS